MQYRISSYSKTVFGKTHSYLWKSSRKEFSTPLSKDLPDAIRRAKNILIFYLKNSSSNIVVTLLIGLLFFLWIRLNIIHMQKTGMQESLYPLKYVNKFPLSVTLLFTSCMAPFVFISPPAAFVEVMWLISAIAVTVILWNRQLVKIKLIWFLLLLLGVFFGVDNLLYAYSNGERWWLLIGNLAAALTAFYIVKRTADIVSKYTAILRISLYILLLSNLLSVLFNCLGHFAFAKLLSNSSVMQLVLAICLSVITEVLTEGIFIQLERMKSTHAGAYLEYDNIRNKFKSYLNIGAVIVWIIGFLWSFSFHDMILLSFSELLNHTIQLGDISFTLRSTLIFGVTLWVSVLLANLLAVIFGTAQQQFATTKKTKLGSWMMLVRLGIISGGFLIAVGAAGIPIDKLAIVFGALSVGIGFGLQNIVGNLVSGIILAFEKPMQIGDVIEIGSQTGTVKEIGIRSSKITTYDGADIIVPNGDFITQKLTNWTHSNTYRRIELIIGVAYGTELAKVTALIEADIAKQEKVLLYPKPAVLVQTFADSAVNLRVLYWTSDHENWIRLKSDTLTAIYNSFAVNGIQIPFPQQDVYIKSFPGKENS